MLCLYIIRCSLNIRGHILKGTRQHDDIRSTRFGRNLIEPTQKRNRARFELYLQCVTYGGTGRRLARIQSTRIVSVKQIILAVTHEKKRQCVFQTAQSTTTTNVQNVQVHKHVQQALKVQSVWQKAPLISFSQPYLHAHMQF